MWKVDEGVCIQWRGVPAARATSSSSSSGAAAMRMVGQRDGAAACSAKQIAEEKQRERE